MHDINVNDQAYVHTHLLFGIVPARQCASVWLDSNGVAKLYQAWDIAAEPNAVDDIAANWREAVADGIDAYPFVHSCAEGEPKLGKQIVAEPGTSCVIGMKLSEQIADAWEQAGCVNGWDVPPNLINNTIED